MSREWKPGDVAIVLQSGCERLAFRNDADWIDSMGAAWDDDEVSQYGRPIVAIDPEDREAVERLASLYERDDDPGSGIDDMQAALREFADPKPPKPEEPMGKWAIVTAFGVTYCRAAWASGKPWSRVGTDHFASWDELDVESIEFEGVR